jgi:hypothetical protein
MITESSRSLGLFADGIGGLGSLVDTAFDAIAFFFIMLPLVAVFALIGLVGVIVGLARGKEAFWLGLICAFPSALCAVISVVSLIVWTESGSPPESRNLLLRYWWLCLPGLVIGGLAMRFGWIARSRSTAP